MTTTTTAVHAARLHADESWALFALAKAVPDDTRPEWAKPAEDSLLLSGRLVGSRPRWALDRFARDFHLVLAHPGDQRPYFDVSQPGRTVLVWRFGGVWVELWHPDTAVDGAIEETPAPDPEPTPAETEAGPETAPVAVSRIRRLLSAPGGRLPYTRRTKKETTTP